MSNPVALYKKFAAYPEYKDSGIEWLGNIPSTWKLSKIAWHFRAEKGKSGQILTKEYCGLNQGEYPVYSGQTENSGVMGNIDSFEFNTGTEGVLFSTTVGAKAMTLSHLRGKFSLSQNCMIIASRNYAFVTRFAYYHFQPLFAYERGLIPEHMQASFRMEDLYSYSIATPSVEEQRTIAAFLDYETARIDQLIAKQQRLIELLKEKRQAVISHSVTKGLNPNAPMKDSGVEWLGQVPEHWMVGRIGYYCRVENGTTPSKANLDYWTGGTVPWLSSGAVNQYEVLEVSEMITAKALAECSLRLLPKDTLVVGMIGQGKTRGMSAITRIEATINQNLAAVIPNDQLDSEFLHFVFQAAYKALRETGRGGNQAALNCELLANLRFVKPELLEQKEIVQRLKAECKKYDHLVSCAQSGIELLQERRTALISAAVTGKIDVRGWNASNERNSV